MAGLEKKVSPRKLLRKMRLAMYSCVKAKKVLLTWERKKFNK